MSLLACTVFAEDAYPELRVARPKTGTFVCVEFNRVTVHLRKAGEAKVLGQVFRRAEEILREAELTQCANQQSNETPTDTSD